MVSTQVWQEFTTSNTLFTVATDLNFGSVNLTNLNPSLYPIVANSNSYEKWIKLQFNGTFTSISGVKLYKSDGTYVTGEQVKINGEQTTWVTPVATTSTVATTSIPTSLPGTANVSIGGDLAGTITVAGNTTDFIVLQSQYSANTSAGPVNAKTFSIDWTEN